MSPIIFTGILSPDIFFLTLRALQGATERHVFKPVCVKVLFFVSFFKNSFCIESRALLCLLEQFDVAHDEFLPVDEDHGHLLLCQQLAVQQRLVEDLHTQEQQQLHFLSSLIL